MNERLQILKRALKKNPKWFLMLVFLIGAVVALVQFPHGFALSSQSSWDSSTQTMVTTVSDAVPTPLALLVFGVPLLVAVNLGNKRGGRNGIMGWIICLILLGFFFWAMKDNFAAGNAMSAFSRWQMAAQQQTTLR